MHLILLIGLVGFSVLAVFVRDLLKAAISLAAASVFLAIIFFRMNAPYAGVFEISVVAGLITVLFMSTIALTRSEAEVKESNLPRIIFPIFFIAFIIIDIIIMKNLLGNMPALPGAPEAGGFGDIFWSQRTFDLVGQIGIILAGVFSVLALFRKRNNE